MRQKIMGFVVATTFAICTSAFDESLHIAKQGIFPLEE